MGQYYIKRLEKQEMGSPDIDGKTHRGRYIYLSKKSNDFFPHLSQVVLNDTILLPIVMSFSDVKVYAKFVYHNSKYALLTPPKRPRNEYRLYLNNQIDSNKTLFRVGDIVVLEKIEVSSSSTEFGFVYAISLFDESDSNYDFLCNIIESSDMIGSHAIINDELNFVNRPIINDDMDVSISDEIIEIAKEEQQDIINKIDNEDNIPIEDIRGANLFNSVSFRDFVLHAYEYKCAITGKAIQYKNLNNLEAAHIQPRAHTGTFLPCNGLALCRDMHWAFDKGFLTITDDFIILVHEEMKNSPLAEYDGRKIFLPRELYFQPEKKFLKHHRENIFGLFRHSGSIRTQ